MIHPDIQRDVLAARASRQEAPTPEILANPTMQLVQQQAAALLTASPELVQWMAHRYLVTNAEAPPAGVPLDTWMLARSLQASVLEDLFALAQDRSNDDGR